MRSIDVPGVHVDNVKHDAKNRDVYSCWYNDGDRKVEFTVYEKQVKE